MANIMMIALLSPDLVLVDMGCGSARPSCYLEGMAHHERHVGGAFIEGAASQAMLSGKILENG